MSMETSDTLRFSPRLFEGSSGSSAPELLLLDGQQRMTSLFLALQSKQAVPTQDEKKKKLECFYYLDMKKCLDTSVERMEAVISVPKDKIVKSNFGRTIELDISTSEKEYASMMFPLNIVFDSQRINTWQFGFFRHFSFNEEDISFYGTFQSQVLQSLHDYKIPVIKLSRETPKDAVCQVFENVNTGGVSLTVFELLTATFAGDDFRLREDWDRRSATLRQIDGILSGVDGKDFLAAVTLLASYRRNRQHGTPISCKRGDILNLSLEEYRANADAITEGLRKAARFLHAQQIFDICNLPYQTQLIPLSAICACLENRFEDYTVKQKLARWYWCGVLGELYGSANETRYALDIQNFIGQSSTEADRKREYRNLVNTEKKRICGNPKVSDVGQMAGQMSEQKSDKSTPEYRDKSTEIREESLESREQSTEIFAVSKDTVSRTDVQRAVEEWNSLAVYGLKPVSKLTSGTKRAKCLNARIKEYGIDEVLAAIERIKNSDFLKGNNKRGWMITFDWFVLPNNFPKVHDGHYENSTPPPQNGGSQSHVEQFADFARGWAGDE